MAIKRQRGDLRKRKRGGSARLASGSSCGSVYNDDDVVA